MRRFHKFKRIQSIWSEREKTSHYARFSCCPFSEPFKPISGIAKLRFVGYRMDYQRHRGIYRPMIS